MVLWLILSLLCLTLCLLISGVYLLDHLARERHRGLLVEDKKTRDEVQSVHDRISALVDFLASEAQARIAAKPVEYPTGMWLPTDEQNAETERALRRNEDHALYAPDQRPRSSRPSRPSGPISGRKS